MMDAIETFDVTIVQTDPEWKNFSANLTDLDSRLTNVKSDLIVLPEMFNTGFIQKPKDYAESMDGPTISWMKKKANELDIHIMGSLCVSENDNFYNRLIVAHPNDNIEYYDKRYLFTYGGEAVNFTKGQLKPLIVEIKGWRIRPFICYDLRFPVWNRNKENYDIAVYSASWPSARALAWRQLLIARAIENQSYVVGVNRVGIDGHGLEYNGLSCIIDFEGNHLLEIRDEVMMATKTIEKRNLYRFRRKYPFLKDQDVFQFEN